MSETSIGSAPQGQRVEGQSTQGQSLTQQGSELKEKGKTQLRDQIDERTTQAGEQVRSVADVLRRTGSELEGESGSRGATRVTSGVADRLERVGGYLEGAKGDDLLRDAERFARERPLLVAGAAAAVGFTLSRLLKASSESRYSQSGGNGFPSQSQSWEPGAYETGRSESDWVEPATVVSGSAAH